MNEENKTTQHSALSAHNSPKAQMNAEFNHGTHRTHGNRPTFRVFRG